MDESIRLSKSSKFFYLKNNIYILLDYDERDYHKEFYENIYNLLIVKMPDHDRRWKRIMRKFREKYKNELNFVFSFSAKKADVSRWELLDI